LYLYAPYFILEDNPARIAESNVIYQCYGQYPGKAPYSNDNNKSFNYYIIHGSNLKWSSDVSLIASNPKLQCGNYADRLNLLNAYKTYNSAQGGTTHMTIVFNTFVFYTLFNQINARVIDDNINIFYRINMNILFILITFIEMGLQAILIQCASNTFKVTKGGLTGQQWGICIGFGSVTFLVSLITKFLPLEGCIESIFNIFSKKGSNKIASITDPAEENVNIKENSQEARLNMENDKLSSKIKKEMSANKKGGSGIIAKVISNRSKQLASSGSIRSIRKNKEN
jgi:hypothetical protein